MNDENDKAAFQDQTAKTGNKEEALNVHNPLQKDDDKKITPEDIENEQTFKEAQTERD